MRCESFLYFFYPCFCSCGEKKKLCSLSTHVATCVSRLSSKALLEFEEDQGAVVSRKLSRSEVQRFPTKVFDGTATAGSTQ